MPKWRGFAPGSERRAYLAEAGKARCDAARARGGAPRKDRLKFVRDVERRMRKSREANLPAGPDGFVGAAAASGKYGPGETVTTRSMYSYISQGLLATSRRICPARGARGAGRAPRTPPREKQARLGRKHREKAG